MMKITTVKEYPFGQSSSKSDLFIVKPPKKTTCRKIKKTGDVLLKKDGSESGGAKRSSRPGTLLLRFDEDMDNNNGESGKRLLPAANRKNDRKGKETVSSRKLAAGDAGVVDWLKPLFDLMGKVTYVGSAGKGQRR